MRSFRRMYSNPNAGKRTLNFDHVRQSDIDKLPSQLDIDAGKLREALQIMGQAKQEEKAEDKFCDMYKWLQLLQKARRQHRRRPHIPARIMRQLVTLKLAKPVRL